MLTLIPPALIAALLQAGLLAPDAAMAPAPRFAETAITAPAPAVARSPEAPLVQVRAPAPQPAPQALPTRAPQPSPQTQPTAPVTGVSPPVTTPRVEPAPAPVTSAPTLSNEQIIAGVRGALEGVETVRGRFRQYAPDGTEATGTYAIRRPGRVRFDYDDPVQLLIVADGTTLAIEDGELETVERVPLLETPLNIILGKKADFDSRARVTDVRQGSGLAAITVVDPQGEYEGELTMTFRIDGWELLRWQTLDGLGNLTSVQLLDTETGVKLDPALFRLEDERDARDRDRR